MRQPIDFTEISSLIKAWGQAMGFQQVGISNVDLTIAENRLQAWLKRGFHGQMSYMSKHGSKRSRPQELLPGTLRIISIRMDYLPQHANAHLRLQNKNRAYISCYALGRDYHKLMRQRLKQLAKKIEAHVGSFGYRAFVDSAPVLEKPIAEKASLGWMGKHTLILNREAGSWFFLGEIFTDLPLPIDEAATNHCGACTACIDICPTKAIVGPYQLDARRCISYLTIEYKGSIPIEFRSKIGNRIFGCDDCQIICPWNRFAKSTQEKEFEPRHQLQDADLIELFNWSEETYLKKTEGSALRRAGYEAWLRNIAVALGNAPASAEIVAALKSRINHSSPLVHEHVAWALENQRLINKQTAF